MEHLAVSSIQIPRVKHAGDQLVSSQLPIPALQTLRCSSPSPQRHVAVKDSLKK
jgi:hypothetical protein